MLGGSFGRPEAPLSTFRFSSTPTYGVSIRVGTCTNPSLKAAHLWDVQHKEMSLELFVLAALGATLAFSGAWRINFAMRPIITTLITAA